MMLFSQASEVVEQWPAPVRHMIRKLESGQRPSPDRRQRPRLHCFAEVSIDIAIGDTSRTLYLRDVVFLKDVGLWSAGFVAKGHFTAGTSSAMAHFMGIGNETIQCSCSLRRCREFTPGWCEGMVIFDFGPRG